MLDYIRDNDALLWWLAIASIICFVGTLIALPLPIVGADASPVRAALIPE